jgi:GT2 family glycosyltransferase
MSRTKTNQRSDVLVDICIPTAGKLKMSIFEKCIQSVISEMPSVPSRLLIYQNGIVPEENKKDLQRIVSDLPPLSRYFSTGQSLGFPKASNTVIYSGHAPLVFFVTDDVVLKPGALTTLVKRMDTPEIALCGMKLLFPDADGDKERPAGRVQHVGHGISIRGTITHPFMGWTSDNPKCCVSREVASVTGAAFMVRRKLFEKAGGFFLGYGKGYFEDVDLCFTLTEMGFKIFIDTDAQAIHYTNQTMKDETLPPLQFNEMILHTRHPNTFRWSEYGMY